MTNEDRHNLANLSDGSGLGVYLKEISRVALLTPEEERVLTQKVRDGDETAFNKLVCANLRFVVSVAKQYANQGVPLEDLVNEGNAGLIKAARRFNPERGVKFLTYAVWWIRQAILTSLAKSSRIVRVPGHRVTEIFHVMRASRHLEQQLSRAPTQREIAERLGIGEEQVRHVLQMNASHVSLDKPVSNSGDDSTVGDYLADERASVIDDYIHAHSLGKELERLLNTLPEREKGILTRYYGLDDDEPMTLEALVQTLGLSRERIRQIKKRAIDQLRRLRSRPLRDLL
jgi:RNA polymerase primary sigma factor